MRYWKWLFILFFVVAAIVFLPEILSSTIGKRIVTRSIESKTHTNATIEQLHLTWLGPQRIDHLDMESPEFQGKIESLTIGAPLWALDDLLEFKHFNKINGDFTLQNSSFQFNSPGLPEVQITGIEGHFRLHEGAADFTASGAALQDAQKGAVSLRGQIRQLNSPELEFSLHGSLSSFPTLPIAHILSLSDLVDENAFIQMIGPLINLDGSASLQNGKGVIDFALHSSNIDGEFHGNLLEKAITLRQALTATLRLTPELSQTFLRDVNPLFVTGIQAKSPIQLRIETRGFRINFPLDLQSIQIGQGTLEAGQIVCRNGGTLGMLISLLKNKFFSNTKEMNVWFSPLSLRLQNGILYTGRMDALVADTIHICSWGNIDLNRNKLDMNLGLTAETLKSAFGIKNVPENYVLKIPLTGSPKKPKLAASGPVAKIAALVAAQNAPKGKISSGILNIFAQPDSNIPPPNRPFPWEK